MRAPQERLREGPLVVQQEVLAGAPVAEAEEAEERRSQTQLLREKLQRRER